MYEPAPGEPGGGYEPYPDGSRQPDAWPYYDWFRPQRGQERGSGPDDVAGEHSRKRRHRHGVHRRLAPAWTMALDPEATAPDPEATAVDLAHERKAGRYWALIAGAVFFLIDTLLMADGFARPVAIGSRVLVIFIWLISLAAIALLWLRASPRFFKQNPLVRAIRAGTRAHSGNGDAIAQ
jgi:hypothetical protein